jgi:hypothetical protein
MGFNLAFKGLTEEIFNFPARRQRAVKCKMALISQQRGWCVLYKMTRCSASGPPRSQDMTVCDFFLWGYVKDRVYVPPLPATVDELQKRITATVNSVTPDILQRVWYSPS